MQNFHPSLTVISGRPLHGKTTVGKKIAGCTNQWLLDVDAIRHLNFPRRDGLRVPLEELVIMNTCYQQVMEVVTINISAGNPVILVAPFSKDTFKAPLMSFVHTHLDTIPINIYELTLSVEEDACRPIIEHRITQRRADNDPAVIDTWGKYLAGRHSATPWWKGAPVSYIDADQKVDDVAKDVQAQLCQSKAWSHTS